MSKFDQLLEGYLRNTLTESELEEFIDLVRNNPDFRIVRENEFDETRVGLTTNAQREKMLANVWAQTPATQAPSTQAPTTSTPAKRIPLWRWPAAAAAAAVLILSVTLFRQPVEKPVATATTVTYKNDVAPGKTGATLQLADGSTVALDGLHSGVIATQGNTRVIRQANGAVAYIANGRPGATQYNKLSTAKGRQFQVVLPDGTKVWLNSSSSISYPTAFTGHERRVEMTGEVYFEVAPNAGKPFIVKAADQSITVLGTNFNVNAYEDEPAKVTTLLQGAIRVNGAGKNVMLTPGEQTAIDHNGTRLHVAAANVEAAVAWKNGYFQFDNADLPTVMRQLARWYGVEVRYEGPRPAWNDFKGQIGRDLTLAQVLKILEQTRVHFRIEEDKRIVIYNQK